MVRDDLVHQVEAMWVTYAEDGVDAFLAFCDDDVEWAPHLAGGRVLHGSEELRAFFAGREQLGERMEPTFYAIERHGDAVVATGALRIARGGALTESQLAWVFQFRDGHLRSAVSHPTRADALRAVAVPA